MALVAYDYASDSDGNEELNDQTVEAQISETVTVTNDLVNKNNLFATLPHSKSILQDIDEAQIEDFIPKSKPIKEKQKVKITIPSLSQFKYDDSEPPVKTFKPSTTKGSGLISLLPPVKGSVKTAKSFVPNVVANKNKNMKVLLNTIKNKTAPGKVERNKVKPKTLTKTSLSDAESDDDIGIPETFDDEMWEKICGRKKSKPIIQEPEDQLPQEIINIAPEPETPYEGLDNKAFKELVGKSKRPIGNIKLIDINEEDILPDKDLWMTKSLTDPEMAPKADVEDPVDPTRRKKHHITYLAQQAKANEQELQNAWAASKNSRLASRTKYGF